ncbi:MAG: TetR family transcriptional regulator [Rhodobacteraceae bacterium]|nr:TetR family transcriptional regulator [Paracoccaceae bacterium]
MSSLRERRRVRTSDNIRKSALELVQQRGLDNVTVESISDHSGISVRTFFNYFPYKEAALLHPPVCFLPAAVETFLQSENDLIEDLIELLLPKVEEICRDREALIMIHEISINNPKLLALTASAFQDFDKAIAALIARRMGLPENAERAMHIAALTSATIRVAVEKWVESSQGSVAEFITRMMRNIRTVFDL